VLRPGEGSHRLGGVWLPLFAAGQCSPGR
jgi:hypothetical protein